MAWCFPSNLSPTDHEEKSSDFPEKTFRTLFFFETSWENIIVKTLEASSQTGAVEMFQKQDNYLNNTANCRWRNSIARSG